MGGVLCAVGGVLCAVRGVLCAVGGVLCAVGGVLCAVRGVLCAVGGVLCAVRGVLCAVGGVLCAVGGVLCAVGGVLGEDVLGECCGRSAVCCGGLCHGCAFECAQHISIGPFSCGVPTLPPSSTHGRDVAENPLSCDRGLLWLYFAQNTSLQLADPLRTLCYWPDHLRGQPLTTLTPEDFVDCEFLTIESREGEVGLSSSSAPIFLSFPLPSHSLPFPPLPSPSSPLPPPSTTVAPTLVSGPEDVAELTTRTVVLPCNITGQPRPVVTWYKDDVMLVRSDGYLNASVAASTGGRLAVLEDGSLRIQQVQHSDQGSYSCAGSNANGTTASNTSYLTVLGEGEGRVWVCLVRGREGVWVYWVREKGGVWWMRLREGVCVSAYIPCMCCRVHLLQRCSGPP